MCLGKLCNTFSNPCSTIKDLDRGCWSLKTSPGQGLLESQDITWTWAIGVSRHHLDRGYWSLKTSPGQGLLESENII